MENKQLLIYGGGAAVLGLFVLAKMRGSKAQNTSNGDVAYTVGAPAVFPVPFGGGGMGGTNSSLASTFGNDAVGPVVESLTGNSSRASMGITAPVVSNSSPTPTVIYAAPPTGNNSSPPHDPPATYRPPRNPAPDTVWANYADARDYWKAVNPNSVIRVSDPNAPAVTYAEAVNFLNKYVPQGNFSQANLERAIADARQYYNFDSMTIQELVTAALYKRDVG